jgi:hypothetical protein
VSAALGAAVTALLAATGIISILAMAVICLAAFVAFGMFLFNAGSYIACTIFERSGCNRYLLQAALFGIGLDDLPEFLRIFLGFSNSFPLKLGNDWYARRRSE